jgi:hypothetical protein
MPVFEIPHVTWYRSSLCSGGDCVEIAAVDDTGAGSEEGKDTVFLMRNSREPAGQILRLTSEEWAGFIAHIKGGTGL